jgi:GNAT superfamily N-acetyltransferase
MPGARRTRSRLSPGMARSSGDAWRGSRPRNSIRLGGDSGGKLFGFITVTIEFATWSSEPFACMDCLYIRQPYWSIGSGRTCLGYGDGFCAARGCRLAEWQIPVDNKLDIGFYQRMGTLAMPRIRFRCEIDTQEAAC